MTSKILCDPYVWENPKILMYTSIYAPNQNACVSEVVNHIVYTALVLGVVGLVFGRIYRSFIPVGLAALAFFVLVWPSLRLSLMKSKQLEGFQQSCGSPPDPDAPVVVSSPAATRLFKKVQPVETLPTARNPFMNVLVDEYKYNPLRPGAASVTDPAVRVTLDDFFRVQWLSDPTDVFGRSQSQRQFITQPSTSIPNDVESLRNWLYLIPGKTCKEGGRDACLPGTDGGAVTWLNQDS
jgi:hypothetical protein